MQSPRSANVLPEDRIIRAITQRQSEISHVLLRKMWSRTRSGPGLCFGATHRPLGSVAGTHRHRPMWPDCGQLVGARAGRWTGDWCGSAVDAGEPQPPVRLTGGAVVRQKSPHSPRAPGRSHVPSGADSNWLTGVVTIAVELADPIAEAAVDRGTGHTPLCETRSASRRWRPAGKGEPLQRRSPRGHANRAAESSPRCLAG